MKTRYAGLAAMFVASLACVAPTGDGVEETTATTEQAATVGVDVVVSRAAVKLAAFGPIDPNTGFPSYYVDANGTRLGLCASLDPECGAFPDPFDPTRPFVRGVNFPTESFYFRAVSKLAVGASGSLSYDTGVFAGFATTPAITIGQEIVTSRIRIRSTSLSANHTYTVVHPYGIDTITTDKNGNFELTEDFVGRALDFQTALTGNIGSFLAWSQTPGGVAAPPDALHIAEPVFNYHVTDSPTPATAFMLYDGKNHVGTPLAQTTFFQVTGRLAP
jgi:hypothetical protein